MAFPAFTARAVCFRERLHGHAVRMTVGRAACVRIRPARLSALLLALAACALLPGLACSQETFAGSAVPTYSDSSSGSCIEGEPPNVFKQVGMNPLACHGQQGPQDSQGKCSYAGMTMIAHIGETCYYCAPIVPPMNGIIIPFDQVRNATSQGFSCFGDQVDPDCMSICTKPGSLKYIPGTVDKSPPVPPGEGPQSGYVAPMPGPDGGVGTVTSTYNPCLPQGPGGYNYCDNGPGARLPAGCSCTVAKVVTPPAKSTLPPPGSKGITNEPAPKPQPKPKPKPTVVQPVNLAALDNAMAACLKAKLPYAFPSAPSESNRAVARLLSPDPTLGVSATSAQLPPDHQIFLEAAAMELAVQDVRDQKYGPSKYSPSDELNFMTGYFMNCLYSAGIQTAYTGKNVFKEWDSYVGVPNGNNQNRTISIFTEGWDWVNWHIDPLPLMPPDQQLVNNPATTISPVPTIETPATPPPKPPTPMPK